MLKSLVMLAIHIYVPATPPNFNVIRYILIAVSMSHKDYKCLDVTNGSIYFASHVQLDENSYPFRMVSKLQCFTIFLFHHATTS